jgi:hypothetical protein
MLNQSRMFLEKALAETGAKMRPVAADSIWGCASISKAFAPH